MITPSRGLVLPGAARHLAQLAAAGLVADAASPWSALSACVGAPSCQQSLINTRAYATALAQSGSALRRTHISGCERRCGAPTEPHQDLVAPAQAELLAVVGPVITAPSRHYDYVADPVEIYRRSFATIRSEADLAMLPEDARTVAVRMITPAVTSVWSMILPSIRGWYPRREPRWKLKR